MSARTLLALVIIVTACRGKDAAPAAAPSPSPPVASSPASPPPSPADAPVIVDAAAAPDPASALDAGGLLDAAAPRDAASPRHDAGSRDAASALPVGKHGEVCRTREPGQLGGPAEVVVRTCGPGLACCYPCGIAGCAWVCHTSQECQVDMTRP